MNQPNPNPPPAPQVASPLAQAILDKIGNTAVAAIRTWVPYLVGLLVTWAASHGVVVDEVTSGGAIAALTFIVGTVWRFVFNWLAKHVNVAFGWALGLPIMPKYDKGDVKAADPANVIEPPKER